MAVHVQRDPGATRSSLIPEEDVTTSCAVAGIRRWLDGFSPTWKRKGKEYIQNRQKPPPISIERRAASWTEQPFQLEQIREIASRSQLDSEETVLYLGYGSNMSAETFQGRRNIKPISQMNALVPELALTFDLPGIPYSEPCFANTRYRHSAAEHEKPTLHPPYHKDLWFKGLVGVVYEITKKDFAHVIATEGGGASYQDVLVDCYMLAEDANQEVPMEPQGATFKAHTLFSPPNIPRADPSYAQPSSRYLKLLKDGAAEHQLPYEYQEYLENIRGYEKTMAKQRLGQFIFLALWGPIFLFIFGGAKIFLDKDGKYPKWYAKLASATFAACWGSYDSFFKKIFGDGERTTKKKEHAGQQLDEKDPLIRYNPRDYGAAVS